MGEDQLIMFLDGTGSLFSGELVLRRCGWGVAVLDFTDVIAPSMVFGGGGGLIGAEQTVARSDMYAGIRALRFAPRKTPLVLISDTEYFVSTAQRGRTLWASAVTFGTSIRMRWSTTPQRS